MSDKLVQAAREGDTATVVRLLSEGVEVVTDKDGWTPLHHAAAGGFGDTVAALLLAGCDANATDLSGFNALQRASSEGHEEVVKLLIKHEVDVDHQDSQHGNTALHEAAWWGKSRTIHLLCRAGANLNVKNFGGFVPLHLCCQNGHNQGCRELLLAGCPSDLKNNYGDTPLHTSSRYGHAGVARILISALCAVSEQNKNGDTALHISVAMGRRKLSRILLESGCDKSLVNKQGETAQDIALRKDYAEIAALLEQDIPLVVPAQDITVKAEVAPKKGGKDKDKKKRGKAESGTSSKESSTRAKEKKHKSGGSSEGPKVHFEPVSTGKGLQQQWSPYGCHYYPDLRDFPRPNLDSLPKEPLHKGEQYYLDLAGNIRKGPVGVGTTCYCGPLLCHVTRQMQKDKRELLGHIDGARQWLDRRLAVAEQRTRTQIQALDLSMREKLMTKKEDGEEEEEGDEKEKRRRQRSKKVQRWLQREDSGECRDVRRKNVLYLDGVEGWEEAEGKQEKGWSGVEDLAKWGGDSQWSGEVEDIVREKVVGEAKLPDDSKELWKSESEGDYKWRSVDSSKDETVVEHVRVEGEINRWTGQSTGQDSCREEDEELRKNRWRWRKEREDEDRWREECEEKDSQTGDEDRWRDGYYDVKDRWEEGKGRWREEEEERERLREVARRDRIGRTSTDSSQVDEKEDEEVV